MYVITYKHVEFLRHFKPVASCGKYPVCHQRKTTTTCACTSLSDIPARLIDATTSPASPTIIVSSDV